MLVFVMGTSMFPIETMSFENETKELSTLFTSNFDVEIGDDGFVNPSLCFNSSNASYMAQS